jgi:transposase-like protein
MEGNQVRFPASILELGQIFSSDEACLEYMIQARWPEGFQCPECKGTKAYMVWERKALKCAKCGEWQYITQGTVMQKSKTRLCKWFSGAYMMTTMTPGMSALQFQRQIGIPSYECAFQMLHKLRAAMVVPFRSKLEGEVEIDETFIGSHRIGSPPGRGAEGKSLVIGAVEVVPYWDKGKERTRAGRARLLHVENASNRVIVSFLKDYVATGTLVRTDGWKGYQGIEKYGYKHDPFILRDPEQASKVFPHVHRVFGNLKAWIIGTFHGVSPKHMQAYLNEYVFRFNRRFKPWEAFNSMLGLASESEAPTYQQLYQAGTLKGWEHPQ